MNDQSPERKGIFLLCNEKNVSNTLCTTIIKDVDSLEIHNESQKSILFSSEITSKSKTMTTQNNDIIKETSSLNLLSNITFNDELSTVLKSVTNQDDVQIDQENHK